MFRSMNADRRKELLELITGAFLYVCTLVTLELVKIPVSSLTRTLIYVAVYIFVGFEVISGAVKEAREGEIFSEETLMSIATIGALILGEFPEAVAVMLLYRVGEWFADYAVDKSRDSISALAELRPDRARVKRNGKEISLTPEDVNIGETIVVLPGERIPLDGEIISGATTVDTSALTGESMPAEKQTGDEVFSGCVNLTGLIELRVISTQADSAVSRILKLTQEAQERKAKSETFIERFAHVYTPIVIVCAALLGTVPSFITGDWATWVHRALVFLTVSCPCALVVSVPLTFFCGIGCASRHGILVKGSIYLENLAQADTAVFDKTGTLTTGGFAVKDVTPIGVSRDELVRLSALAERFSTHPIAKCVSALYTGGSTAELIYEKAGMGVKALIDGSEVLAGNKRLLESEGILVPQDIAGSVYTAKDGVCIGALSVSDNIKPTAADAISELKRLGFKKSVMLSGDTEASALAVSKAVGIDETHAKLMPEYKVSEMERLSAQGKTLYTGDGINDAPVLAASYAGAAMGGLGSDAAINAADIIVMDDKLTRLPLAVRIGRRTLKIAMQNTVLSLAVKAAILITGIFVSIPMYIAIIGDVGMLLCATANALRALMIDTPE
ncbi:MAG: cadmium-translocating P-type ATPase [Clostridia bacterium]|nr:cadmium-translocating P-type ATPase [Clostridia bacterium]